MSISLYVYSPLPPLERTVLTETGQDPRLPADLRWEIAFLDSDTVLGWRPGSEQAGAIRAAVASGDRQAIDQFYEGEVVASCALYVRTKDQPDWKNLVDDELVAGTPEAHRPAIAAARTHYSLETSARRNDLSLDFQYQLWRMVGVLASGLMEDPQEGQYVTKDGEVTQLETGEPDDELERELARLDRVAAGRRLFTVAVVVLLVAEAISLPLVGQRLGTRHVVGSIVQMGLLGMFWSFVRGGESWSYWALVTIAFGYAAMWTWALVTPPPSPWGWTILQVVRTVVHVAAGCVLLLPATRAYVAYERDA